MAKIFFSLLEGISNFSTFFRKNFSRGIDPLFDTPLKHYIKGGYGRGGGGTPILPLLPSPNPLTINIIPHHNPLHILVGRCQTTLVPEGECG
jgi:hypothetical protein